MPAAKQTPEAIVRALRELHTEAGDLDAVFGPKEIAAKVRAMDATSKCTTSLVSAWVKTMIESNVVERVSLGKRRGVYRLVRSTD